VSSKASSIFEIHRAPEPVESRQSKVEKGNTAKMFATSCTDFGGKNLPFFWNFAQNKWLTRNALECGGLPPLFLVRACSQFWCEICGLQNGQQAGLAKAVASYRTPRRLRRRLATAESQIFLRCFGAKCLKRSL
jgi:hypothetical protein